VTSAASLVSSLAAARKAVQLYPPSHPAFSAAIAELVDAGQAVSSVGPCRLNLHQGRLYHESEVIAPDAQGHQTLAGSFETRKIESLVLHPGFGRADAIALVEVLSLRPGPDLDVARELASRAIMNVTVDVLADDQERKERDRQRAADRGMYQRILTALRLLMGSFHNDRTADLSDTVRLVGDLLGRIAEDQPAVLALATTRGQSESGLLHSLNVMIYTLALGRRLGLPDEGLLSLGTSALLHDVGKAALESGDASPDEIWQRHPEAGADLLGRLELDDPAPMLVAFEHHMLSDGSGFPSRDASYVPHPYTRMVQIADRYENLCGAGTNGDAKTPDHAMMSVLTEAGGTLDPFFARLFASAMGVFPTGCVVRLSNHSVGVVCDSGAEPLTPVVRTAFDEHGHELREQQEIDLSECELHIVEVIDPDSINVAVAEKL
jgi:HD-GYP domain-containing protein (c-di-GMP phosphodiesterase class II)